MDEDSIHYRFAVFYINVKPALFSIGKLIDTYGSIRRVPVSMLYPYALYIYLLYHLNKDLYRKNLLQLLGDDLYSRYVSIFLNSIAILLTYFGFDIDLY